MRTTRRPAKKCLDWKILQAFERLDRALEKQGAGPFFNGANYSLVDAAYAPFLQREFIPPSASGRSA